MGLLIKADSLKNVNKIDKLLARLIEGKKKESESESGSVMSNSL